METLLQFGVLAFLVESLVETFKPLLDRDAGSKYRLLALGISVPVTALAGADLFAVVGFDLGVPYVGSLLTGVMLSRGASAVHDMLKLIVERRAET